MLERLILNRTSMALAFRPVDVSAQARALRLQARGREDGQRNYPDENATEPSLAEDEVVGAITEDRERWVDELASNLRAQRDALAQLQTAMDVAGLRQSADDAIAQLGEIRAHWSGDVAELRRKATEAADEHEEFKRVHGIRRGARLPGNRPLNFSILIFCIASESIFNGLFFANGSDLGLVGGVFLALCLSCVNVVGGALNGAFLLRRANSDRIFVFLAATSLSLAVIFSLLVFNGFVAHYRDLYQATGDSTDMHLAWSNLLGAPFGLQSIFSWLLFAAGVGFSGLATWEGYSLDDPFPGYGAQERRRLTAREKYLDARRQLIEEAADVRDRFSEETAQARERLRGASARREQITAARARMLSEFNTHESNLEDAARRLLSIYRQENEAVRSKGAPPHFSRRFSFGSRALDRAEIVALRQDQGLEHDAKMLIDELDGLRQRVMQECAAVIAQAPGET